MPSARRISAIASVPVPTPTACAAPDAAANSCFERLDLGTEDEPAALDHAIDRAPHVGGVLAGHQRHERDPVRAHVRDGSWSPPT